MSWNLAGNYAGALRERKLNCTYFLDYPVPALLYDAQRGNTTSTRLILGYYCVLVERNQPIPQDIQRFVARKISLVLDRKIDPNEMFTPQKRKAEVIDPLVADLAYGFNWKTAKLRGQSDGDVIGEKLNLTAKQVRDR